MELTNTCLVGNVYHRFDELLSTNDYARELLSKSKPPEGTVVRADSQSAGRGQYGSRWESEPGKNLLLSIIFYPDFLVPDEQFRLNEFVSLAVRDAVAEILGGRNLFRPTAEAERNKFRPPKIKWPNDIYIGEKKVAGILIQNTISMMNSYDWLFSDGKKEFATISQSIVGIGLNVNQLIFKSDAPNPTSLAAAAGHFFDLDEVANILFKKLEIRYLQIKNQRDVAGFRTEYLSQLLGFGEEKNYRRVDGSLFSGVLKNVLADGKLLIENGGRDEVFNFKDVKPI